MSTVEKYHTIAVGLELRQIVRGDKERAPDVAPRSETAPERTARSGIEVRSWLVEKEKSWFVYRF
jgi:hypothetical protein